MVQVLSTIFWLLLSFMVSDYLLGRVSVPEPARLIIAGIFSVSFVVFCSPPLL